MISRLFWWVTECREEKVTEKHLVKRIQPQLKKALKSPEFVNTDQENSDNNDEKQEPVKNSVPLTQQKNKHQSLQILMKRTQWLRELRHWRGNLKGYLQKKHSAALFTKDSDNDYQKKNLAGKSNQWPKEYLWYNQLNLSRRT